MAKSKMKNTRATELLQYYEARIEVGGLTKKQFRHCRHEQHHYKKLLERLKADSPPR
jgi:hypothetical protein